jgi:SAM-dependent methyltransferase
MSDQQRAVAAHYASDGLLDRIIGALAEVGCDPDNLEPARLTAVDQLHSRGAEGTAAQIAAFGLPAGALVLDIGAGLGGPARTLASTDCRVVALDLTEDLMRAGAGLTARCGMTGQVIHLVGDGCRLPLCDGAFDAVWTQYALMNVPDKTALFAEAFRALRPGGRMCIGEPCLGSGAPLDFPVPWGTGPALTHLLAPAALRQRIERVGFHVVGWSDETAATVDWGRRIAARPRPANPSPLGPQLVFGSDMALKAKNLGRAMADGRLIEIRCIAERRG